jgi:hypothetical protein
MTSSDGSSATKATLAQGPCGPGNAGQAAAVSHRFSRCPRTGDCERDYHDCDRPLFKDPVMNGRWYMCRTRSKVWIWVREPSGGRGERVVAKLDLDMWEQATRICELVNRSMQSDVVFVGTRATEGEETLREWYGRAPEGACGSLGSHLPGARIWVDGDADEDDDGHVFVWLETDRGCWGPGVRALWGTSARKVIKAVVELAARHVGELVACGATVVPAAIGAALHTPRG